MSWPQTEYIDKIVAERDRQDRLWGNATSHRGRDAAEWYVILGEEFGEVGRAIWEGRFNDGPPEAIDNELIQVAAVALAWLEARAIARMTLHEEPPR